MRGVTAKHHCCQWKGVDSSYTLSLAGLIHPPPGPDVAHLAGLAVVVGPKICEQPRT